MLEARQPSDPAAELAAAIAAAKAASQQASSFSQGLSKLDAAVFKRSDAAPQVSTDYYYCVSYVIIG